MRKWAIWGIIFYIHSLFLAVMGTRRITAYNYDKTFTDENVHAYVGGDAYNYIINSNLLNAYYVVATGFFLSGTILIATGAIIKAIKQSKVQ